MLQIFQSTSTRCTAIGFGVLAGSLTLQGVSALIAAEPVRTRSLLEFLYGARGALLQSLNVMALSLVTAGLLRARLTVAASTCAAWALAASLIESAQHPAVVDRLLLWAEISSFPSRLLDSTLGLFWNARFAWSEVIASLVGGAAAFLIVRRQARRARSDASALR